MHTNTMEHRMESSQHIHWNVYSIFNYAGFSQPCDSSLLELWLTGLLLC